MKKLSVMMAAAAMMASASSIGHSMPSGRPYSSPSAPLNKKQIRRRKASKLARKQRKLSRPTY